MDEDFINVLESNAIKGVDFGRRDKNIVNEIYGYSKGAADSKFKHPQKGIKMDRTSDNAAALVPPLLVMEYYKYVHLNLDVLFVNNGAFLLAKSREIGSIHCKAMYLLSQTNK